MNKLLLMIGMMTLHCTSRIAAAQLLPAVHDAEITDTTGLRSKKAKPEATALQENGLPKVITLAAYDATVSSGLVTICESLPAYQKRNRKDNLTGFIQENLRWPVIGRRICVEGRVLVSFVVGTDGIVYRSKTIKGLHPDFDAEALRVVQLLSGHFSPAVCGGVARPHEMVVPVLFFLK